VNRVTHAKSKDSTDKSRQNEAAAMYSCSMHPEVRQNQPRNSLICGMMLIETEKKSEH
jgi:hypothetical protein